jgi:hypothetical protein
MTIRLNAFAQRAEFGIDVLQLGFDLDALVLKVAVSFVCNRPVEGNQLQKVFLDLPREQDADVFEQPLRLIWIEQDPIFVE